MNPEIVLNWLPLLTFLPDSFEEVICGPMQRAKPFRVDFLIPESKWRTVFPPNNFRLEVFLHQKQVPRRQRKIASAKRFSKISIRQLHHSSYFIVCDLPCAVVLRHLPVVQSFQSGGEVVKYVSITS